MPLLVRRYIQAVTGITMIGIGVAFNYMANLGLGPWGVLHDGISNTINITYGQAGIMTSLISLLLWIPLKQKPGIATIFDAFWIGLTADFVINIIPDAPSLVIQIIYLITGITGQDGSFISELLLKKKYKVHGYVRKSATGNLKNIKNLQRAYKEEQPL